MKQRLLALAAVVAAAGAGTLVFVNWDTGLPDTPMPGAFDAFQTADCTPSACAANLCTQADNVLADAGSACRSRLVTCDNVRVGQRMRDWAADAGLTLGPQRYQTLRFVGMRCPGVDGGFSFGIPLDDTGLPQFSSATQMTPPCVRAPLDGGTDCRLVLPDAGLMFYGTGNVFPAAQSSGTQCEAVSCRVVFGDDPDTSL